MGDHDEKASTERGGVPELEGDGAVGFGGEAGDVDGGYPAGAADAGEVVVGRPTGDGAAASDVEGDAFVLGFGKELGERGDAEAGDLVGDAGEDELGGVGGEDDVGVVA